VCSVCSVTALVVATLASGSVARASLDGEGAPADTCPAAGRDADPLEQLRRSDSALSVALRRRVPEWSPEADIVRGEVDRVLAGILDYEDLARRALGGRWYALDAARRQAFLALFVPLTNNAMVDAASRRVRVSYDSETIQGPDAVVAVTARLADRPGDVMATLQYHLALRCHRWFLYDVTVDGASSLDGSRAEFTRLFKRGNFDDVLAIMRRKVARHEAR